MVYRLDSHIDHEALSDFCRRNHIRRLSLYGSALRGSFGPDSDIDLLVEFEQGHVPGLISLVGMENELSRHLGKKVDLRTPGDLSRHFRDDVMREAKVQYEA